MVGPGKGSKFADFVRFRPYTHALSNLCRHYGRQLQKHTESKLNELSCLGETDWQEPFTRRKIIPPK